MAGTTLIRASVDSVPQSTKSNPPLVIALANTFEVIRESAPTNPASVIIIASSAPIERAFRTASLVRSGPIEITVIV